MLLLLSPAKTLDFQPGTLTEHTQPRLLEEASRLNVVLQKKSTEDLQSLMKISEKLALLNRERFQNYNEPFTLENAKQALAAFKGDVYTGMGNEDFDEADMRFSQQSVRILSGLYGVLRPLDLMQAYRLEMGTKLTTDRGKNLYEYWGNRITETLNEDLRDAREKSVVNLASQEYFKSVNTDKLAGDLYHVHFKENRNGKLRVVAFNAKKARGMMTRYVVKNRLTRPEQLKAFADADYIFNDELSTEREFYFTR